MLERSVVLEVLKRAASTDTMERYLSRLAAVDEGKAEELRGIVGAYVDACSDAPEIRDPQEERIARLREHRAALTGEIVELRRENRELAELVAQLNRLVEKHSDTTNPAVVGELARVVRQCVKWKWRDDNGEKFMVLVWLEQVLKTLRGES